MSFDPSPWAELVALPNVRPYQLRALEELQKRYQDGARQACLVAPPGAGKTLCALLTAVSLNRIVDVCVPTTALVEQWETVLDRAFEPLVEGAKAPVCVSTYAGLKSFRPDALVILDEAHHVQAKWGGTVQQLLGKDNLLLGLTATPPLPEREAQRFFDLVGNDPVYIDAPPLVRDSHLAPYLEFVWPVLVDTDDAPLLREVDAGLRELEQRNLSELTDWMRRELREHLWEMTEDRFAGRQQLLVSLCRTHRALGGELPLDLPPDAELLAPPTLLDRAVVLAAMTNHDAQMLSALRKVGFSRSGEQIVMRQDLGLGQLTQTRARLRGCMEVLLHEWRVCGESLRALVLTDRDAESERLSSREILKALVNDPQTDVLDPIMVTGSCFWVDDDLWPRIAAKVPDLPWQAVGGHHEIDVSTWEVKKRVALATQLLQSGATHCLVGTLHLLGEGWDCPAVNCLVDLTGIAAHVSVGQMRGRALRLDPQDPAKVASLWEIVALLPGVGGGERMLEQCRLRHTHTFGLDGAGNIRSGVERIDPVLAGDVANVAVASDVLRHNMQQRLENWHEAKKRWQVGKDYLDRHRWQVEKLAVERRRSKVEPKKSPKIEANVCGLLMMMQHQRSQMLKPQTMQPGFRMVTETLVNEELVIQERRRYLTEQSLGWFLLLLGIAALMLTGYGFIDLLGTSFFGHGIGPAILGIFCIFLVLVAGLGSALALGGFGASLLKVSDFMMEPLPNKAIIESLHTALFNSGEKVGGLAFRETKKDLSVREAYNKFVNLFRNPGTVSDKVEFLESPPVILGDESEQESYFKALQQLMGKGVYSDYLLRDSKQRFWSVPTPLGKTEEAALCLAREWSNRVGPCQLIHAPVDLNQFCTEDLLRLNVLRCLYKALKEAGLVEGRLLIDEKSASIVDDSTGSRTFAEAAQEMLGPVRYPRYLLLDWRQTVWPVPSVLGTSKEAANQFAQVWARQVSACQIVYARHGEGKELLIEAWKNNHGVEAPKLVEYWE